MPSSEDSGGGGGRGDGSSHTTISLAVRGQDGEMLCFQARIDRPVKRILTTYCQKKFLDLKVMRFLIDRRDFDHQKTPVQLGLKGGELIVAVMPHNGG